MTQKTFFSLTSSLLILTSSALFLSACMQTSNESGSPAYVAPAEPFPHFGKSLSYAVLSAQGFTNTGMSTIYGDIGVSPRSNASGLSTVTRTGGETHMDDSIAAGAQNDAATAYRNIETSVCETDLSGQNLSGLTLTPGTYCFSGDVNLSGLLTLDAQGNNRANFVFQVSGALHTQTDFGMRIIHNGESCNVFWQVATTVGFGSNTNFIGGIIALGNVTMDDGSKLNGKIMSRNGSIAIDRTEIYNNFCPWW